MMADSQVSVGGSLVYAWTLLKTHWRSIWAVLALTALAETVYVAGAYALNNTLLAGGLAAQLITQIMLYGAVFRLAFADRHPGDPAFALDHAGLQWRGLEWRLLGAMALLFVFLLIIALLGMVLVGGVALGVTSATGAALPDAVSAIFLILLLVGALAAVVYPLVRLSLSMPMTMAQQHIRLFESWRPTHGRFWPLAGAILLCLVLIGVVLVVAAIVTTAVAAAVTLFAGGSLADISSIFRPDGTSLATYFTPTRLIVSVLNAPVSASVWAILAGPFAEAYLAFAGPGAPKPMPLAHPEPVGLSA